MASEGLLAPKWTRAVIGAAAATLIMAATRALLKQFIGPGGRVAAGSEGLVGMVALLVPMVVGGGLSLVADLDRGRLRFGLAMITGAVAAVATFLAAAIWSLAVPVAAGVPIGVRAFLTPAPPGVTRLEHVLYWTFAGAFVPTVVSLFGAFLIRIAGQPGSRVQLSPEIVYAAGAGLIGAVITLALIALDPEKKPAEPTPPPRPPTS